MMDNNGSAQMVTVRVQRFNPDVDQKPYLQEFSVPMTPDTTILDALHYIKAEVDGSLTFRRSCRHAICGSCAMNVNGHNILVCKTPLRTQLDGQGRVTIRPLPYLLSVVLQQRPGSVGKDEHSGKRRLRRSTSNIQLKDGAVFDSLIDPAIKINNHSHKEWLFC